MHQQFKALSLSHQTAPLHVRELVALNEDSAKRLLFQLREVLGLTELFVLSTCNRTEVYYSSAEDRSAEIIALLGIEKGLGEISRYHTYFTVINSHNEAVRHLFEVAIGLQAQVVGDMQITNQVKQAYQWTADLGLAGPFLHRLLHAIFFTSKKVAQQTRFRDGAASVSYATAELVDDLTTELVHPKVLVVGLGEIGTDVCKNLSDGRFDVAIANRTLAKAEALAQEHNLRVIAFENVWQEMASFDVVICSVAKNEPFITKELVTKLNLLSYKFFIDLAVPRSVESSVEEVPGALVYHIDLIQNKATEALQKRLQAIPHVQQLITEAVAEFSEWTNETAVSPAINKFKNALEQIRQEELARYVKNLSSEESERIDRITKGIMQKIIKLPVLQLKAACKRGDAENLIDGLNDLFNLEKQPDELKMKE